MTDRKKPDPAPEAKHCAIFDSPCGPLTVTEENGLIISVDFGVTAVPTARTELLDRAERAFSAYFAGEIRAFTLPCSLRCTDFQRRVIEALPTIPYGETISYGELARRIGQPNAARAVGQALNRNPLPILYPCHRVIGGNGALTGFGGGLSVKRILLDTEQNVLRG